MLLLLVFVHHYLSKLTSFVPSLILFKSKLYEVNAGKWISTEESQVADWYHSVMTIGPEPK
jgi:hypothetical protein